MPIQLYQIDSFTQLIFKGNPAGVCFLEKPMSDDWMQNVSLEMNLSETAFILPENDAYRLRWFTPEVEVALCGHATLASAHVLWNYNFLPKDKQARFNTLSGLLTADYKNGKIELDFPAKPEIETTEFSILEKVLGAKPIYVGKSQFDVLVEVENDSIVKNLNIDFALLKTLKIRGLIVTAKSSSSEFDFISRFFAPAVGVNEDPVTGSAHCVLATFWNKRLNKNSFHAYQASKRGGVIDVILVGDRVKLSGYAVTVFKTELI